MSSPYLCRICDGRNSSRTFIVKEMMFGLREGFTYSECARCGSLQLEDIPDDMKRFYPEDYAPLLLKRDALQGIDDNPIVRYLRHKRSEYVLGGNSLAGRIANVIRPGERLLSWLRKCNVGFDSKILDVGCGSGSLLVNMERLGFRDLSGVDLYIERDIRCGKKINIRKGTLENIEGKFDLIMMHHSLEHISSPLEALGGIGRLLKDGGRVMIRTPIASSYAWSYYGVNWVQLDAPRHQAIISLTGAEILARRAGLKVDESEFDSTEFQFIGSEQYLRDIPLVDPRSYYKDPANNIFSKSDIDMFKVKAVELNRQKRGDEAVFYMSRA